LQITELTKHSPEIIGAFIDSLTPDELKTILYDWKFWARPEQLPPDELFTTHKFIWLYLAGRGAGKTRTMAEFVLDCIRNKGYRYISLVGATAPEVRTIIIEGESGILNICPPDFRPDYEPSKKQIKFPNGAVANIFYGTEPDLSRGAQSDLVWMDEVCKWQYPQSTYDNIMFGLRLGKNPLCCISTTPKPIKVIKDLLKNENAVITRGSTYDNRDNLAPSFIDTIIKKYEGTRLGRQELLAEILVDNPGALWKRDWIDRDRSQSPELERVVVAIDPKASSDADSESGIIVAGKAGDHYYILADRSIDGAPHEWAKVAVEAYKEFSADRIVAEVNNGGDMVESTIRNIEDVPFSKVWASRGKITRAEPVSALSEQGRIHHVGFFPELEDQLCEYEQGGKSPDRLDAMVWAVTYLMTGATAPMVNTNQRREKTRSKVC
jgi:phage terminase large subunit-like protein